MSLRPHTEVFDGGCTGLSCGTGIKGAAGLVSMRLKFGCAFWLACVVRCVCGR